MLVYWRIHYSAFRPKINKLGRLAQVPGNPRDIDGQQARLASVAMHTG